VQWYLLVWVFLGSLKDLPGVAFAQQIADQDARFAVNEGVEGNRFFSLPLIFIRSISRPQPGHVSSAYSQ
jgi:hypothetical protein